MRWLLAFSSLCFAVTQNKAFCFKTLEDTCELKILTPSLQERKTLKIVLDNGLKAYLISDKGAQESAAALAVHVGSWSDPKEYPGMAHFLEHMLFMGTKAYPSENAFSEFIAQHGGISNAYTSLDRTVYSFTSNHDAFEKSLDIFSHFFIDPLFKASEVGRELHAIDQEHAKNIHHDMRRQWMIFKELGNPDHPNRSFATGCASTLGHVPQKALRDWYEKNYSSDLMQLVICSPLSLEKQQEIVKNFFSNVEKKNSPDRPLFDLLSSSRQYGVITYIEPVKDLKLLSLDWELPQNSSLDREAFSAKVIASALSDTSCGGLCDYLKQKHWIESLQAGVSEFSSENSFLSLSLSLTKEGTEQINAVIQECFGYLHLLKNKGIPSYVFEEMKALSSIHYQYQSREKAFEFVTSTADELLDESFESYPQKTLIPKEFNSKEVHMLLERMTPMSTLITVLAPSDLTHVPATCKEMWNQGEYAVKPLDAALLKSWNEATAHPHMKLPERNPYIPSHLALRNHEDTETLPSKIINNEKAVIYFWQDDHYHVPETNLRLAIKSVSFSESAEASALMDLFIKSFYHHNLLLVSKAEQAGLSIALEPKNFSLLLKIKGYSEKAPELTLDLLERLKKIKLSRQAFEICKDSLASSYKNQKKAQPYQQAGEFLSSLLYTDAHLSEEKGKALESLTYEKFHDFASHYFDHSFVEGLICGNLTKKEAVEFSEKFLASAVKSPLSLENQLRKKVLVLEKNQGPFKVSRKIETIGNATLLALWQGPFSFENKATQVILATLLSDQFFNTLRSQQQTGYITASFAKEVEKTLLQFFVVQSATHQPEDLLARFELFLEGYSKDFSEKISQERFEDVKKNTLELLSQLPANLDEKAEILFLQGFERKGHFTFREDLTKAVDSLDYDSFKRIALSCLSRKNTNRLALLVEGDLPDHPFVYEELPHSFLKEKAKYVSYSEEQAF